jgi:hypothetical protein
LETTDNSRKQDQREKKKKKEERKAPPSDLIKVLKASPPVFVTWLREDLFTFHLKTVRTVTIVLSLQSHKSTPAPSIEHPKQDFHQA